jgi:hypothetical protein
MGAAHAVFVDMRQLPFDGVGVLKAGFVQH